MGDTSYKLMHAVSKVREGKLDSVREFISSSRLHSSEAWSQEGYVLLLEALKYKQKDIAELLLVYDSKVNNECTENSNTPLHFAVLNGDIEIVEMLLDRGANVNAKGRQDVIHVDVMENGEGYTPLHLAVTEDREAIIKLLLSRGADVNATGKGGITSLHIAAAIISRNKGEKYLQTVKHLLNHGAYVDAEYISSSRYWLGNTPLHFAVQLGCRETVELLLSRGANVNARTQFGLTALHIAIKKGHKELVELLLKSSADINFMIYTTPLHTAVMNGRSEIVEVLLNFGADIESKDKNNRTALYVAIQKGRKKLVEVLLKCGAKIDFIVNSSLLHVAVIKGHTGIVKALLKFGADIDSKDQHGRTALHIAIQKGHKNLVQVLLKCGAKIDFMVNASLFHKAVTKGYTGIVEALLKFGVDIESKDKDNRTALYVAIEEGHTKLVELLLQRGAKINFMVNASLLHKAVTEGHTEMVEALLKVGADIDSKDKYGRTALHIAVAKSYKNIIEILLKFGADIDSKDECGRTALSIASSGRYIEIIKVLLKFDADIDSKDKFGRTEFHYANYRDGYLFLETLLEHGCDINVTCKNNITPLEVALTRNDWRFEYRMKVYKRHIIKMKAANLYVSRKNLLLIKSDDEISYKGFQNECEEEIASMKGEKFNNVNVSFYDILTEDINQLAMYAGNESIAQILRSEDYKIKFPKYANMINNNFRKGEKRREFLEQSTKIFYIFRNNFGLPQECTEEILSYLGNKDLRILFSTY